MLFLYRMASATLAWLLRPALFAHALYEGSLGKVRVSRVSWRVSWCRAREFCAIPTQARPDGGVALLWLHGVDLGEAQVALRLAQDLWQRRTHLRVLITTTSRPAAALVARHSDSRLQHQFAPFDCRVWWRRFLDHWRPSLAVRCENEFWPNCIIETAQRCPLLFVQARMSAKSFRLWQGISRLAMSRKRGIAERTMSYIDLALCQDDASARFLKTLGVRRTEVAGNLKSLPALRTLDADTEAWFANLLAHRKLWIAASTHAPEEKTIIEAQRSLLATHPEVLCIIAPRSLQRVPAITQQLTDAGSRFQRRSQKPSSIKAAFFLLDSFGELNYLYRWAKVVFVGGTLVEKGGHNMFEPARHGCRILHGPYLENTHAPLLKDLRITQEVRDAGEISSCLQQEFDKTLKENKKDENRKKEVQKAIEHHHKALRTTVLQSLEPYLTKLDAT